MSVSIAGIWELGWNAPLKEAELWEFLLMDFGISDVIMCPITGIKTDFFTERENLNTVMEEYREKGIPIVFVDEQGTTPLAEFEHPEDVLYVFGRVSFSPFRAYSKPIDQSLKIETPKQIGTMWPHQCAAIVLYDRVRKWQ